MGVNEGAIMDEMKRIEKRILGRTRRIHFVGIGGIGMSGIAEVLLNQGFTVTGSDRQLSPVTERLQTLSAVIYDGHEGEQVLGSDVVVISSAVGPENIEVRAAQDLKIPVLVHTGSSVFRGSRIKYGNPQLLDDVAVDFPDLKIIMAHSGRGLWYKEAFFISKLHENIYMEVSGLPPKKLPHYFPRLEENADSIIFGSDWPGISSIKDNIKEVNALPLKKSTKKKILGENARKLLNIK